MATGNSSSFTPRKEAQELGQLTIKGQAPSVGINSFSRGINVSSQQAVQFGAPYVSTQQTANFIQNLGQFNDSIRSFGASFSKYDTAQNALQGESDALGADPEVQRKIFREGLDQAVKDGLFPENAHPIYRMNFIQTAATAQAYESLPEELSKTADPLTTGDNTDSIGSTLSKKVIENANQLPDALARKAYIETGMKLARQTQQQAEARREVNFKQDKERDAGIAASGAVNSVIAAVAQGDEASLPALLSSVQQQADSMYAQRIANSPKKLWDAAQAQVLLKVANKTITPEQGQLVLDKIAGQVTAGTGTLGSIPDIGGELATSTHKMTTLVDQQGDTAKKAYQLRDFTSKEKIDDYLTERVRNGQSVNDFDTQEAIAKDVAKAGNMSISHARRLVKEEAKSVSEAEKNKVSDQGSFARLKEETQTDPTKALESIELAYNGGRGAITRADRDVLRKEAIEQGDIGKDLSAVKFSASDTDADVDGMFKKSPLAAMLDAKEPTTMQQYQTLKATAQDTAQRIAIDKVKELRLLDAESQLRTTNPTEWNKRVLQVTNEAKKEALVQASQLFDVVKDNPAVADPTYGPQYSADVLVSRSIQNKFMQNPDSLDVADKYTLSSQVASIPNKEALALTGNEVQRKQASAALDAIYHVVGVNPVDLVNGKTKQGYPIDASRFDKDKDLFFQSVEQWNVIMGQYAKVSATSPQFEETYGFKLLSKLGIDPYSKEAESFLLRQKTLVEKRAIPTVNKFIKSQLSK